MERDFKGVWIPKEIWLDTRLNALDKVILTEIDSLDDGENGCYASNQYLSEFCQCSATKVSTAISKLQEYGYIEQVDFDGRHRKIKSCLTKIERQPYEICKADIQNLKANNIDNNKDNKNLIIRGNKADVCKDIVYDYNMICSRLAKVERLTDSRKKHIRARLGEHSREDLTIAFHKLNESDFACGNNDRGWEADFDWLMKNEENITKVLEGKYDNRMSPIEKSFARALDNIRSGVNDNGSYFD